MTTKKILFEGSEITYTIYGEGQPIMLLHGFGEDSSIWNDQINILKNKFLLIVPDLPGCGRSTLLQKNDAGIDDYATCMKAIVEHEQINNLILIGHSMGGYITLSFAEKFAELLSGIGLVHSGAFADNEEKINTRRKAQTFIKENGAGAFLKTSIPGLFYNEEKSSDQINELISKGDAFSKEALIQYYEAMIQRPDRTNVLRNFKKPVLMLIGRHDKAIPFSDSLQQCYLPETSFVHILRKSGHIGMFEESKKTSQILADFCEMTGTLKSACNINS